MLGTLLLAVVPLQSAPADGTDVLAGLRPDHPRLILTEDRLAELKGLAREDALLAKAVDDVLRSAEKLLGAPALEHVLIGPRLLSVSRDCVERVYTLGLAWRWTGDERFARGVESNLRTVCAFPDWNPSHFLDTAEMSHAVGVGYDWIHGTLEPEARAEIRAGLLEHGLGPGLEAYEGAKSAWWTRSAFNWNQVCNGGLTAGALAIAEDEPDVARRIVGHAVASLPTALATYEPDGAWGEGYGYWIYATDYTVVALASFTTALGHDFGLGDRRGLELAGAFPDAATGPTGLVSGFADGASPRPRRSIPVLFWLAHRFDRPEYAARERAILAERRADPRHVLWYATPGAGEFESKSRLFRGDVELGFLRSAVAMPTWVGFKAGYNAVNHGHLDLGAFELDMLGQRWVRDLGKDDYNLPGYWEKGEGGRRWTYFRLGSSSHPLLTFGDRNQAVAATASFRGFGDERAVVDVRGAYPGLCGAQARGIELDDHGVTVQDEATLLRDAAWRWCIPTDAEVELSGGVALLRLDGETLGVEVIEPAGAEFVLESAHRDPPEKSNEGVSLLVLRGEAPAGALRVVVRFDDRQASSRREAQVAPLADWAF